MKTNIYLPIEIKRRELYSRIYIAIFAALKGYRVTLGKKSRFHEFYKKLKPGNYISKSIGVNNIEYFKNLKNLGHKILYIDEEGLMSFNKEFTHRRIIKNSLELIDTFFTWGSKHQSDMIDLYPDFRNKYKVVGNPRFDIIKKDSKSFYLDEVRKIKDINGDFFLLTTKFGKTNYVKRKNISNYYDSQILKGLLPTNELKNICKRSIKHEEENFNNFLEFIKLFSKSLPNKKLIILVHPTEDKSTYEKLIINMKNIKLANDFSSNSWILSSNLIIQNNCTTSLEAYLLGVRSVQLNFFQDSAVEYEIPKIVSEIFQSNQKLISFLDNFQKTDFQNEEKYQKNLTSMKKHIENISDQNSVELILNNLFDFKNSEYEVEYKLEKIIYKFKNFKRYLFNYFINKGGIELANNKIPKLDFKEVENFMKRIIEAEGNLTKNITLKENLPGLFTIETENK
jgi:surface carbohydrate biosynthesis protein